MISMQRSRDLARAHHKCCLCSHVHFSGRHARALRNSQIQQRLPTMFIIKTYVEGGGLRSIGVILQAINGKSGF